MDASTANSHFRVPRTVEEESALVSEARPSSTKYKDKWAVEIFHEWQRTRTLKFPDLEVGSVFKDYMYLVCSVEDNLEDMDALTFNHCLAKFIQEVANKKGGHYPPRTLYGIVCRLKRHLEEVRRAHQHLILWIIRTRGRHVHIEVTSVCLYF